MKKILSLIAATMMLCSVVTASLAENIAPGTTNTVIVSCAGDCITATADYVSSKAAAKKSAAEEELDIEVVRVIKQVIKAYAELISSKQLIDLIRRLRELFGSFLH